MIGERRRMDWSRVVAGIDAEPGGVTIDRVAPISMTHTAGQYVLNMTGGMFALFPGMQTYAAADLAVPAAGTADVAGGVGRHLGPAAFRPRGGAEAGREARPRRADYRRPHGAGLRRRGDRPKPQ